MSPEQDPELHAVSDEEPFPGASEDSSADIPADADIPAEKTGRRGWLTVLLILALGVACLGYFYEDQRARDLEIRVSALQSEIQEARQDLLVHEQRMQVVRGHVDDLAGRFELLQQAIEIDTE